MTRWRSRRQEGSSSVWNCLRLRWRWRGERYGEGVTVVDGNFFDEALTARCHVKRLFEHAFFCAMAPSLRWIAY